MKILLNDISSSAPWRSWLRLALPLLIGTQLSSAISLDINDKASIKHAAGVAAKDMLKYYIGDQYGEIPGILQPPYYWWEGGAMWMSLIDYWWYTGDDQYNDLVTQGIQFQRGPDKNFMNMNWSLQLGNDDQAFWGFAAMEAAELKFPNPPRGGTPWLALAQAVFNIQSTRFTHTCGGGLPWQVYITSPGYSYKNTISNGCFFALAARLARYTKNDTYIEWGKKAWDWTEQAGLITEDYIFWDGTSVLDNCSSIVGNRWTYNPGVFMHGAASLWNYTQDPVWYDRLGGIVDGLGYFFQHKVMVEMQCEANLTCNYDQRSFKGYLARWMAVTMELAPWTRVKLMPLLQASAKAAAQACIGGKSGTQCGLQWIVNGSTGHYDGSTGPGEQMAAMSVMGALMTQFSGSVQTIGPVTAQDGGISKGNPALGLGGTLENAGDLVRIPPASLADKIGAWILTAIVMVMFVGGGTWACWSEPEAHLNFVGGGQYVVAMRKAVDESTVQTKRSSPVDSNAIGSPIVDPWMSPTAALQEKRVSFISLRKDGSGLVSKGSLTPIDEAIDSEAKSHDLSSNRMDGLVASIPIPEGNEEEASQHLSEDTGAVAAFVSNLSGRNEKPEDPDTLTNANPSVGLKPTTEAIVQEEKIQTSGSTDTDSTEDASATATEDNTKQEVAQNLIASKATDADDNEDTVDERQEEDPVSAITVPPAAAQDSSKRRKLKDTLRFPRRK